MTKKENKMLGVYGGYIIAKRQISYATDTKSAPVVIQAINEDEAQGKALWFSRERYPPSAGWYNHAADVIPIPPEWLQGE